MTLPAQKIDFSKFNIGSLFLIRTPDTFPEGYAEKCFEDMKRLHFDYAAWLETWNCADGILWCHPDYPRSSLWEGCPRDPLEETFLAADANDLAFLPECGMMHKKFMLDHSDAQLELSNGQKCRYGRIGLVPAADITADYFIAKYEALINKFGHHKSFQGICMPAENSVIVSYDKYSRAEYKKLFGTDMPSEAEWKNSTLLTKQVYLFAEEMFLKMYRRLAQHLKGKFGLPLMHYPLSKVSNISHLEPNWYWATSNLELIDKAEEIDLLNLQLHPPLGNHPRQFKMELELLESITDKAFAADMHFYHETNAGKLPDLAPKRTADWILSTLSPYGTSFFCYGFMAEELPLWKKELNPTVKVAKCYSDPDITALRRKYVLKAMDFTKQIGTYLENTRHQASCAVFYRESLDEEYRYGSYYREHLFGLYEALQATALPLIFTGKIPVDASEISCLIFDAVKSVTEDEQKCLKKYLASGGQVILVGNSASELYDICGFAPETTDAEYVLSPDGEYWHFYVQRDAVKYTAEGEIIYSYDNGRGAVIRNGNAWFVGAGCAVSAFENIRQTNIIQMWRDILRRCSADSGVKLHVTYIPVRGNEHEYLSTDIYAAADNKNKVLLLRNFGTEISAAELNWQIAPLQIKDVIVDGQKVLWKNGEKLPEFEYFALIAASAD